MRSEFDELKRFAIADILSVSGKEKTTSTIEKHIDNIIDVAIAREQNQQSKIDELQKRVDAVKQMIQKWRDDPVNYAGLNVWECVARLEQALKGGLMRAIKIPCEHDLLSKNDDTWADAVMRCKGGSPYCGADGYCHAGGTCFANQELTREQAILEVDRLAQELHNAKIENDKLRNMGSQLVNHLELIKEQNLKNGNDQRVFALKFCIHEIKKAMG